MGDRVEPPEHRPATADGVAPEDQAELDSVVKGDAPLIDPDPKEVTDLLDEVEEQKREYDESFLDSLRDRLDSLEQEVELAKQMPRPDDVVVKPPMVQDDPGPVHFDTYPLGCFISHLRIDERGNIVQVQVDTTWYDLDGNIV